MRRPPRVYVDTSVFGGTQDDEFREPSRRFFEMVRRGAYVVVISRVALDELADAPVGVQEVLRALPEDCVDTVSPEAEEEARELAEAYISAGALGRSNEDDALHVATATVARADLVVSWNFRHIVNYRRIAMFNGVNVLNGYPEIKIHSPLEVVHGDEGEEGV